MFLAACRSVERGVPSSKRQSGPSAGPFSEEDERLHSHPKRDHSAKATRVMALALLAALSSLPELRLCALGCRNIRTRPTLHGGPRGAAPLLLTCLAACDSSAAVLAHPSDSWSGVDVGRDGW
ncbi:unnamed protein product [Parajaminaea phylloscopi]